MPTFEFKSPEGKTYSVDGPDGATPDQAFQILQQHLSSAGLGEDLAKSAGAGLANAAAETIGALGDARSLASAATDYAGDKLGISPDKVQAFKNLASKAALATPVTSLLANAPTSRDVINAAPDPIVSPDYKPQTALGGYVKTGAEFLPGMLAGGPEGLGQRFLTNVAAPAVASETAGKLTEGTAAEPYARLGGALVGGAGASAAAQKLTTARSTAIPTGEELLKTGGAQFDAVKASDAIIKPAIVEQMAKDIKTELLNDGKHPTIGNQSGVFSALDRMEELGKRPGGVTTKDMEVIRKNLTTAKMDADGGTREAARQAVDSFMSRYSALAQNDLLHGQNPSPMLKEAIANWAAGKRSNAVTGKVDLAELNAGTAGSGANIDNNMRQAIKQLARPQNNTNIPIAKKLGFNDQEISAIKQAATGTAVGNTARYLGKYAPTGIVSAAGGAGLGHLVGGPAGAAIPVVGYVAKKIGDLSTKRAVSALDSLVRSRSPLAAQVAAQLPPQITSQLPAKTQRLLRALAVAAPARQQMNQQLAEPVS